MEFFLVPRASSPTCQGFVIFRDAHPLDKLPAPALTAALNELSSQFLFKIGASTIGLFQMRWYAIIRRPTLALGNLGLESSVELTTGM